MRKKGNPRFKKVTKRVKGTKSRKGYTTTVYKLKRPAKK
jgi:hypothetical protein